MKRKMSFSEEKRIYHAIKNKVVHFSPTISPAPKNISRNEIESIYEAVRYYYDKGIKDIILQPKYMGSYCDIYLCDNITESKFFSRNGFLIPENKISREDLIRIASPLRKRLDHLFQDGAKMIIIQAELLPWSILGQGLIDNEFKTYEICHRQRLDYINNTSLYSTIESLKDKDYLQFVDDYMSIPESEVKKKYKSHVYNHYLSILNLEIQDPKAYEESIELYSKQLDIYGEKSEPHFNAFNVLKIIYRDGSENICESNISGFKMVSDDIHLVLHLTDDNLEDSIDKAYNFYYDLVRNDMEGVIVKPDTIWDSNVAPMFKIRNNKYLQLIYGVNFTHKYSYYLNKRKVNNKVKCSINEWNIAQTLLRIPYDTISSNNKEYKDLVRMRILEEDLEKSLDSRL
jgi:hypothetical protein